MKLLVFAANQPQDIYSQKAVPQEQTFGFVLYITLLLALFWLSINIIVPWLVRFLVPKKFFNEDALLFKERKFESALYRKLKVVKWKDKLPDAGKLIHFQRDTLPQDIDQNYINRFITECCIAELGHLTVGILGFASLFFVLLIPGSNTAEPLMIFLILSIMDFIIQMLFIIIQRYNRPRLIKLRRLYSHGYKTKLK
ncbi:MAG: hypothetical protein MRZ25_01300 [Ruminococcus sp.]|nr:hypothetical protein [Ruminococcus sp.]MDY2856046.1 hypothetical protein [Oscillospiraceae bacterium]